MYLISSRAHCGGQKMSEQRILMVLGKPSLLNHNRKFIVFLLISYEVGRLSNIFLVICRVIIVMGS